MGDGGLGRWGGGAVGRAEGRGSDAPEKTQTGSRALLLAVRKLF